MAAFGEHLLVGDAAGVEVGLVVQDVLVEEVGGAHAEPHQLQPRDGLPDLREIGVHHFRSEVGAVGGQPAKQVGTAVGREQRLAAAAREARDGAALAPVERAEIALHERHHALGQLAGEVGVHPGRLHRGRGRRAVHHVAVRHHDDHLLRLALGDEVVQDDVELAHLEPGLLGVGGAADQIEDRIFLVAFLVSRRGVDHQRAVHADHGGLVVHIHDPAVRDVVERIERVLVRHLQQAGLELLVGEDVRVVGILHADAVHHEVVGVNIGLGRLHGGAPHAFGVAHHRDVPLLELARQHHLRGPGILVVEGHAAVGVHDVRLQRGIPHPGPLGGRIAEQPEHRGRIAAAELAVARGVEVQQVEVDVAAAGADHVGLRDGARHRVDDGIHRRADAAAVAVDHFAHQQGHDLAAQVEVTQDIVIDALELHRPVLLAGVGLALVHQDALDHAVLLRLFGERDQAAVGIVVIGGEHPLHPSGGAVLHVIVDAVRQEGLDVAAADGDVDDAHLDIVRKVLHQRPAEVVGGREAGAGTAERRDGGVPLALLAPHLGEIDGRHHLEAVAHALEVLRLNAGVALHVGLSEAEVDVEIGVLRPAGDGRQQQEGYQENAFHMWLVF